MAKVGDPTKLSAQKFSARAKRATLRGDPSGTYKKGGVVCKARGGGVEVKGKTKGKMV